MNSGALAAILIALTRSEDPEVSRAIIENASWFGSGLTLSLFAVLFYSPHREGIEEIKEEYEKKKTSIATAAIFSLISAATFLIGIWETIGSLKLVLIPQEPA